MTAIKTQGTTIQRGDGGGPETFTTIGEIISFSGLGGEASEIETTSVTSTSKEFILGLPDGGDFTITVNLDPQDSQQTGLRDDRTNGTLRNFKITLTDTGSTTIDFAAYVKGFSINGAVDEKVTADITLRVNQDSSWT